MPTKALLLAVQSDPDPTIAVIKQFNPELVCFFLQESSKQVVESEVPAALSTMPRGWDWIVTEDPESFPICHKAMAQTLEPLLKQWNVAPGELTIDLTNATPAMASAMTLVGFPFSAQVQFISSQQVLKGPSDSVSPTETAENPWDEEAPRIRREAAHAFNQGWHEASAQAFRTLEHRVSGGSKPLYRALADMAQGYSLWEQFQYRQAWEKLKGSLKALELASVWGGPPGMDRVINGLKGNLRFLESLALDPKEIKAALALDLFAWAKRRTDRGRDIETAARVLLRGLEATAQQQLFTQHQLKSWDVHLDQLPTEMQTKGASCYLNDIDGKFRLPLLAQFQALQGLGNPLGKRFSTEWPKMKSLFDAADHAIMGYGFESLKVERFHQLFEAVLKLTDLKVSDLPAFPNLKF